MNKTLIIAKKEYMTRVGKRLFWIMTLLGPVIFGAIAVVPALLSKSDKNLRNIVIATEQPKFFAGIESDEDLKFELDSTLPRNSQAAIVALLADKELNGVVYVPANSNPYLLKDIAVYFKETESIEVQSNIRKRLNAVLRTQKLAYSGLAQEQISSINQPLDIAIKTLDDGQEKLGKTETASAFGLIGGFAIYFFIFSYGVMVMRAVIDEKTSRVIEIIITSVKPISLMVGKMLGIGAVGITQYVFWIVLTGVLLAGIGFAGSTVVAGNPFFQQVADSYTGAQLAGMLAIFFIYFILGFALYASMFAIVGASVDNETDMQQFVLPITAPLIIGIAMAQNVIQNPNSPVAHWLSIIPFTSPILMIVRYPFGVPLWQLGLSVGCMFVTVVLLSFLAAKIYRFGILNYGKKATIAQLWAWIKA